MARKKSTEAKIKLVESVGIEQAANIKNEFSEAIKSKDTICVDLSQITDIDTSIIQLIFSAKADCDSKGKKFYVDSNIPEGVQKLFTLLSISMPLKEESNV